uniref:Uncharacterized protein n=1 Tax=Arundo donax TaxID=35708 RepID=A0A0A8Y9E6_ARUDO
MYTVSRKLFIFINC